MAQTTLAQSTNFGDNNSNYNNTIGSYIYNSDGDAQIIRWLCPLAPDKSYEGVRTDRLDGVGDVFLETSEWRQWRGSEGETDKAVLFYSRNPGVGKTYLR